MPGQAGCIRTGVDGCALGRDDSAAPGERGSSDDHHDAALGVLDGYEGYRSDDPDGSPFRRVALQCLDAPLVAWCYLYNRAPAGASVIGSGDWLAAR